jgi:pimeloyl-ACP methyl ester carboxylesterase
MSILQQLITKALLASIILLSIQTTMEAQSTSPVKDIVIVHGAFADGSGWEAAYTILTKRGYSVAVVQNPLSSLEEDVEAATRAIDRESGPVVLVGHSWGGTVITQANAHPKVAKLVYIAAPFLRKHIGLVATNVKDVAITDSGHWVVQEQTDQVLTAMKDFYLAQ